ncbi:MAG TPA: hypothetical protein VHF88_07085 [Thermoleophilaceae bacterium]|nr:hypothetical protein [Thermoleophilaceae bacterium]
MSWLVIVVAALGLAVMAAPAHAGKTVDSFFGGPGTSGGEFQGVGDVALNQVTGDAYVSDYAVERIQRFSAADDFELTWGQNVDVSGGTGFEICTVAANCQRGESGAAAGQLFLPSGLAISEDDGSVYVAEGGNRRVSKFDADGNFLFAFGWGVDTGAAALEICTIATTCQRGVSGSGAGQLTGANRTDVEVDQATGDVLVTDPGNRRIQRFDSSGGFLRAFGWGVDTGAAALETCTAASGCQEGISGSGVGQFGSTSPVALAVDASGDIYALDHANGRILRFDPSGATATVFGADVIPQSPTVLAVDPSTDHVLVGQHDSAAGEARIKELDSAGALVDTHLADAGLDAVSMRGLAVSGSTGDIYVTNGTHNVVLILDDDGAPQPALTIAPATGVTAHGATLHGTVDSNTGAASYRFEYSRDGVTWIDAGSGGVVTGDDPVTVTETVSTLEANSIYRVRLVATKRFGGPTAVSAETTVTTPVSPPDVTTGASQHVAATSARLLGRVNPNNLPTTYYFELGTSADYGSRIPIPAADAGSAGIVRAVAQDASGLTPATTYHYRLVATNSIGTSEGEDRTFTTRGAVAPPPGRAYEMVTTPDKNNRRGGESMPDHAAANPGTPSADGESLLFGLRFGILDREAGTAFPHQDDMVVIRRTAAGWRSDAVQNIAGAESAALPVNFATGVSADLDTQAWQHRAWQFPSGSRLGTRVFGDGGGLRGSGWYDWIVDPLLAEQAVNTDSALIDDDGDRMLRWGGPQETYRGLLGPTPADDPSNLQIAGDAIYLQEPPGSGPRHLVNECTGTTAGGDATMIPTRQANGTIAARPCERGAVTSVRGASVGAGGEVGRANPIAGPSATAMSDDGRRVFFMSPDPLDDATPTFCATGTGAATDCPPQLYVRQYGPDGATVRWISRSEIAGQSFGLLGRGTSFEGASRDGRFVYFRTNAPLTEDDPNGTGTAGPILAGGAADDSWDLYRYRLPDDLADDPADGDLTRISGGPSGTADPSTHCMIGAGCGVGARSGTAARYISDDGRRAYFVTASPIDGADATPPANGTTTPGGTPTGNASVRNLYLYDDRLSGGDRWRFVARLPYSASGSAVDACATANGVTGMPQALNSDPRGLLLRAQVNCVRGTPDGDAVVFETAGQLTEDDDDSASDVYLYEADTDRLTRVSAPLPGASPYRCADGFDATLEQLCNADLGFQGPMYGEGERVGLGGQRHANLALHGERGLSIYFESRLPLVEGDTNGDRMDVYEWRDGKLTLISPGNTHDDAWYSGNSRDGQDVFFQTSQRIDLREIEDADFDIYDARVGGGFPPPSPPPVPCDPLAGACQGPGGPPMGISERTHRSGGSNADTARVGLRLARVGRKARRRAARTGVVRVRLRITAPGKVTAVARARIRTTKRRSRVRTVARRSIRVRRAGSAVIRLRLNRPARRQLAAGRALRLTVTVRSPRAGERSARVRLRRAGR